MSSILKRKRGPVEVFDALKRSKSLKTQNGNPLRRPTDSETGWEAAFNPPTQLGHANGVNGNAGDSHTRLGSPESINFEDIANQGSENYGPEVAEAGKPKTLYLENVLKSISEDKVVETKPKGNRSAKKAILKAFEDKEKKSWKLSHPIGGRMIDADPVFTSDENFMIVARRTTIQVYATLTSLLTRSIPLSLKTDSHNPPRIITFCLSPTNPDLLWIACSDGTVFSVDWTTGAGAEAYWTISSTGCVHMTVAAMESAGRKRDVVFTTEIRRDSGFRITANELYGPESLFKTDARTIYTTHSKIHILKSVTEGSVLVGASENRLLVGRLRSTEFGTIDKIRYEFRSFEVKDPIKSLDLRVSAKPPSKETKKSVMSKVPVVDLVVGDIKGVIFVHDDLAGKLFSQKDSSTAQGMNLVPRKLHWHRKAVHTVKWSLDGNYIISGGTETVLVLWQLDTGKQQFLPHMAATIQNVVVSPTGTSYAIQLSDNSAMILSTADMEPKTNIAGIQVPVIQPEAPLEFQIPRIDDAAWPAPLIQHTPAVINPNASSRLLLAVGQIQEVQPHQPLLMSNPFLQTFDLGTNNSISSQALTRTNITNINSAPSAHRLIEPRIVHMKISHNGQWLGTVEEWMPPDRDFEFLNHSGKDESLERQYRREVHLKFWQWNKENNLWELVSRIDTPHPLTDGSGRIFDLVADPSSLRFATLGSDGTVRTWGTKSRKQDGVVVKGKDNSVLVNWHCLHAITLGKPELQDEYDNLFPSPNTGCVAFSEDGSILAAACGGRDGIIHLIDPESGEIRVSQTSLFENEIFRMEFLGPDLIILSDRLVVFDLVADETKLAFDLQRNTQRLSIEQKTEMFHLAVDPSSRTFALALPNFQNYADSLQSANSELLVFHQDHSVPQLQEVFSGLITALIPATSSEGYLILDSSAEIYTVLQKGSQTITALAQSTSALGLDSLPSPSSPQIIPADEIEEVDAEEYEPITPEGTQDDKDDDDEEYPVVTQQQLAEVFDIGPAFALPPLEEMFFQVADLFAGKPLRVKL